MRSPAALPLLSILLVFGSQAFSPRTPLLTPETDHQSNAIAQSTQVPPLSSPTPQVQPIPTDSPQAAVGDLSPLLDQQERIFSATVARMEWLFNVLVATIAIAGLLTALLGTSLMSRGIERAVDTWLDRNASTAFEKRLDTALSKLEKRYDDKFAELYKRIDNAFSGERKP